MIHRAANLQSQPRASFNRLSTDIRFAGLGSARYASAHKFVREFDIWQKRERCVLGFFCTSIEQGALNVRARAGLAGRFSVTFSWALSDIIPFLRPMALPPWVANGGFFRTKTLRFLGHRGK